MKNTKRATYTTVTILGLLGLLAFASASGAINRHLTKDITSPEDMVICKPQRSSSADLWTCTDYYGNEFKNLIISQTTQKDTK